MDEPSVLDYLKALLTPWKGPLPEIPQLAEPAGKPARLEEVLPHEQATLRPFSLATSLGLLLLAFLVFMVYTTGLYGEPRFNLLDVVLILLSLYFMVQAFWVYHPQQPGADIEELDPSGDLPGLAQDTSAATPGQNLPSPVDGLPEGTPGLAAEGEVQYPPAADRGQAGLQDRLSGLMKDPLALVAGLLAIGLVLFFRLYRLGSVPPEMNSDHAEKIFDILRVLRGEYHIFFAGNGGREALIFYLGAAVHLLGLPLGFTALKVVSIGIGLAAQPFIYLLGKELGGARVGWLAFVLSGIAYWPNVVSRFGLRLPFYILFTASTLYFLLHGLRTARRNDFIFAGISLGLGLYGYTPDRLLPLVVLAAVGLYLLHHRTKGHLQFALTGLVALSAVAFVLFVPLLSYILVLPDAFLARTLTRMASAEQPLQASAWSIFYHNVTRALGMFSYDAGVVWPTSIPSHAALGGIAQVLFYFGCGLALIRYIRSRNWTDLFLLVSIPLLQLPSTLALAFPDENPNLYRTGGTLIPVFLLAAMALDWMMRTLADYTGGTKGRDLIWAAGWGIAAVVIAGSAIQEYNLVFKDYYQQYLNAAQNTGEMGNIAKSFIAATGSGPDNVFVMGFPHWVDSRLVAINAGYAGADFRMFPENLDQTLANPKPKLFFVNLEDQAGIQALKQVYPQGWFEAVQSQVPSKNFLVFFSIPQESTP